MRKIIKGSTTYSNPAIIKRTRYQYASERSVEK